LQERTVHFIYLNFKKKHPLFFSLSRLTKATTWIDPRPSHYAAFQSYCTTLPLPEGYEQRCDAGGNIYFIDHKSKKTCWDDPRLSKTSSLFIIISNKNFSL